MPYTTDQRIEFDLDDDYEREMALDDEDSGSPLDLTNAIVKLFVKPQGGGETVYTLTTENGGLVIVNVQGGVISITPNRTVQAALSMTASTQRQHAVKVWKNGKEKVVAKGPFIIGASSGSIGDP